MRKGLLSIVALAMMLATGLVLAAVATAKGDGNHLNAQLRGTNEVPAAPASNRGKVEVTLKPASGKVCWEFTISKIDGKGNAAHIHRGKAGVSGPVFIALGTTYKRQGCTSAAKSKINVVAAKPGAYYVNVHNAKHLGGAMRGQLRADL
jgi:CHRD domain-containing protein